MWKPTASMEELQVRAALLAEVRHFFLERGVLEVETPLLCSSTATDPHLDSLMLHALDEARFLQTSPEFPMKRLLAAGSGPIYQICKAFRKGEQGRFHNPEFTLLEWYRPGFSLDQLVAEIADLVLALGHSLGFERWGPILHTTYAACFQRVLGLDPHKATAEELAVIAKQTLGVAFDDMAREDWLDLLMSHCVEPAMPKGLMFLLDFPVEQAALAEKGVDAQGRMVAKRAELYINGVEVANAYQELLDPREQRARFEADNEKRRVTNKSQLPMPEYLLGAMQAGIPKTAGVALGVDRLLMQLMKTERLEATLSFPWNKA